MAAGTPAGKRLAVTSRPKPPGLTFNHRHTGLSLLINFIPPQWLSVLLQPVQAALSSPPLLEPGNIAYPTTTVCLLTIRFCKDFQFYMTACQIVARQIYYWQSLWFVCDACADAQDSLGRCSAPMLVQNLQAEYVV